MRLQAAGVMVEEGIAELAPYAAEAGVKLAIEPFHPVRRRWCRYTRRGCLRRRV